MSDSASNPWAPLYAALSAKGFQLVGETVGEKQLRLVGRVPQLQMPQWLKVLEALRPEDGAPNALPWSVDISKQYFKKGGKTKYAWRLILQGENLVAHIAGIIAVVSAVDAVSTPEQYAQVPFRVMEVPLYAAGMDRNDASRNRGKGAQPTLKAVVGQPQKERMGF